MTTKEFYRTKAEIQTRTSELRTAGYNIITFGKTFREMEKGNHIIVIDLNRNK